MRAVAYLRVSTEEQNEESQFTEIKRWAEEHGVEIVKKFVDRTSGSSHPLERPGFQKALDFARTTGINTIIMYDMTRFARLEKPAEVLHLLRKIMDEYGVTLVFVKEPEIDDPLLRELWLFIKSWFSSYERLQISMRSKYGIERRREEGRLFHRPRLEHYYAAFIYNKELRDVTPEEVAEAERRLANIIKTYFETGVVKRTKIGEYLRSHDLAALAQRFPKAPISYYTAYRIAKKFGFLTKKAEYKRKKPKR